MIAVGHRHSMHNTIRSSSMLAGLVLLLLVSPVVGQRHPHADSGFLDEEAPENEVTVSLTRLTAGIGLTTTFTFGNTHTGGTAWVDYNGDYWPDLFITNGFNWQHYLYRNNGDGTFTDVSTLVPKPDLAIEDAGVLFADVENDGDEDILVYADHPAFFLQSENFPDGGPNMLYRNEGGTSFTEVAGSTGIVDPRGWRNIAGGFADYDRDGFVDVYLGHWHRLNNPSEGTTDYDRLLRNDGTGSFVDASSTTRVNGYGRDVLTSLWFDANMDGWLDLYVTNTHPETFLFEDMDSYDILYMNDPNTPWFWDGTGDPRKVGNDATAGMGMDVGDVDADGDWDLYITDTFSPGAPPLGNPFYLGNPDGFLTDNTADLAGIQSDVSWPCNFADFDLDGWTDLWVGTESNLDPDYIYTNDQDGTFTTVLVPGFDGNASRGGSIADYDGDGDMDLSLWLHNGNSCVYRNDTVTTRNWVEFRLFGTTSNRSAIGAKVWVTTGGLTQVRRVTGGDSAHSQADRVLHFGVDTATSLDLVVIDWPNGLQEQFVGLGVNDLHFIEEGTGLLAETLLNSAATWSMSGKQLTLATVTNHGGREQHTAVGFGPMPYLVTNLGYRGVFLDVPSNPGTVTVDSDSGASFVLNVTSVP